VGGAVRDEGSAARAGNVSLLNVARRWWILLLVAALIGGVAAYASTRTMTRSYEADASLLTGPINADLDTQRAFGNLARTYAELATSGPVLRRTIRATGVPLTVDDLRGAVNATSNDVTRIVTLRASYKNPDVAAELANEIGDQLIEISSRGGQLAINAFMADPAVTVLSTGQQARVRAAAIRAFGVLASTRLRVVDPAEVPNKPSSPRIWLLTVLGILGGVVIAAIFALLREASREDDDARSIAAGHDLIPFLGSVGDGSSSRKSSPMEYERLAAKIGFATNGGAIQSLLVVGADRGDGSGTVAANLAEVLADRDSRVLLIDANTEESEVTSRLGLHGRPGYADVLERLPDSSNGTSPDQVRAQRRPDLAVIPRGVSPIEHDLIDVARGKELLRQFGTERDDVIVIDAPAAERAASTLVWARIVDATVLVRRRSTSREVIERALQDLSLAGANIVGMVSRR
jgi:polysaccharide biosynthesis transport protein